MANLTRAARRAQNAQALAESRERFWETHDTYRIECDVNPRDAVRIMAMRDTADRAYREWRSAGYRLFFDA